MTPRPIAVPGGPVLRLVMSTLVILAAVLVDITGAASAQTSSQQRGFALPTWRIDGYDAASLESSLRETRSVGANWVQFTPTWYQQTRTSSEMFRTSGTVSDSGLERAIGLAHKVGLKVLLKPHVDLPVPGQDSRNNILPEDRAAWFAAYTRFITHYAALAQRLGVEQFAVGTELSSVSSDRTAWVQVIDAVRATYDGAVLYAAGRDWATVPFWDAVDMIGIDAYLPLSDAPTTDVPTLQRGWDTVIDRLAALSAQYGHPILFTEAGYTSQRGTVTDPSNWRISTVPDQAEQAAAYQALLTTFSGRPWWAGVFWWVWITPPDTIAEPLDFSPRGKMAESVVRQWWSS